ARQLGRDGDVVIVCVGAQDALHLAATHRVHDGGGVVGGVDDVNLVVVAHDPDVVVHLPLPAVEGEDSGGDYVFYLQVMMCHVYNSTTDRRTSPAFMVLKASSTSSRPMRSETNLSNGKRPCRCSSTKAGKSRSGRQSPYQA